MAFLGMFDFEKKKSNLRRNIIRYNNFNKLPFVINTIFEVVLDCKNENLWDKALDSLIHVHELYIQKLQSEVCAYISIHLHRHKSYI